MFKEKFIRLCNERGEPPTVVCQKIGVTSSAFSKWTDESVPRKATLMRIADYFGVSTSYLLGTTDDPTEVLSAQVFSNLAASMQQVADELDKQKKPVLGLNPILSSLIDSMSKDELEDLERYAEFILSKKKG
jgi:transcriptional regulator with XRE-family HTH domain